MARTKVFVGNLSFNTKENELTKEFEAAGKVISVNIITRGPRSLGYGFVEMDNETDAENAVKLLNKKEIDGRPINVEVAKPREEGAEQGERTNASRGGRGRGRGGRGRGRGGDRGGEGRVEGIGEGRGEGRGGFRPRGDRGGERGGEGIFRRFKRRTDEGEENTTGENNGEQRIRGGFRGRGRGGRGGARREERPQEDRTPSTTTLFVANLPFALEDDGFGKVLKDGTLSFKSAHVVKKKSGRSKGFGFIEFDNEGDQQKALNALNNKQIEGRELVVKVALTENRRDAQENTSAQTETK